MRADGQPQTSPVWFLWDGERFLIYSMPASQKVPNIGSHPQVALNLDSEGDGGGIVTFEGAAEVVESGAWPDYVGKYERPILDLGYTVPQFESEYSTPIRVTPSRVRVY